MIIARRTITLDEKIKKAEVAVATAKVKYDAAVDELEKLVTKRKQQDDKRRWRHIMPGIRQRMRSYALSNQRPKKKTKKAATG